MSMGGDEEGSTVQMIATGVASETVDGVMACSVCVVPMVLLARVLRRMRGAEDGGGCRSEVVARGVRREVVRAGCGGVGDGAVGGRTHAITGSGEAGVSWQSG